MFLVSVRIKLYWKCLGTPGWPLRRLVACRVCATIFRIIILNRLSDRLSLLASRIKEGRLDIVRFERTNCWSEIFHSESKQVLIERVDILRLLWMVMLLKYSNVLVNKICKIFTDWKDWNKIWFETVFPYFCSRFLVRRNLVEFCFRYLN